MSRSILYVEVSLCWLTDHFFSGRMSDLGARVFWSAGPVAIARLHTFYQLRWGPGGGGKGGGGSEGEKKKKKKKEKKKKKRKREEEIFH